MNVHVCGERVRETESEKLLGLVINEEMTWKHYLYGEKWREDKKDNFPGLIPKLTKRVGLFKHLRNKMCDKTFNLISSGIFNSLLIYCLNVFGNVWQNEDDKNMKFRAFAKNDLKRLQILQNQTLRLKLRASKYTSCKDLVNQSGELSVHQLIALHTLLQVHKVVLKKKPEYIFDKFSLKLPENARIFPHRQELTIPINTMLSISRSSFLTRGARIWNRLPI